jgi:hypothetical protein
MLERLDLCFVSMLGFFISIAKANYESGVNGYNHPGLMVTNF